MPRLHDLEAKFLLRYERGGSVFHREFDEFSSAHGVMFLCPKCFAANQGPVGTHRVICWFVGRVPVNAVPGPGRWNPQGTGLDDLTFIGPGAASVLLMGGCNWHGFVKDGGAE